MTATVPAGSIDRDRLGDDVNGPVLGEGTLLLRPRDPWGVNRPPPPPGPRGLLSCDPAPASLALVATLPPPPVLRLRSAGERASNGVDACCAAAAAAVALLFSPPPEG